MSATFAATAVKHSKTTTCTGADGTYAVTHAVYTGASTSSDPRLSGTLEVNVNSVLNTTTNLGELRGTFHIRNGGRAGSADGRITGVLSGGSLQGLAVGHLHGAHPPKGTPPSPPAQLLGSLTATYSSAGGFTNGSLGAGSATNTAIAMSGSCPPPRPHPHPAPPQHPKPHGPKH